jgi:EAL domain-containing protein (putative c-di-GMP-specific phosphodiesterase class I)
VLKIDRSFVRNMATDDADASIVRSTISLGHALGLAVVGEGVEDERTWGLLNTMECDQAQGYFISRPLPAEEVRPWLLARTSLSSA